jgi:hypothetical protein
MVVFQDYQAAIRFTVSALRGYPGQMSPEEQFELGQSVFRVSTAAARRGAGFDLEFWGPEQLVTSLEMMA